MKAHFGIIGKFVPQNASHKIFGVLKMGMYLATQFQTMYVLEYRMVNSVSGFGPRGSFGEVST